MQSGYISVILFAKEKVFKVLRFITAGPGCLHTRTHSDVLSTDPYPSLIIALLDHLVYVTARGPLLQFLPEYLPELLFKPNRFVRLDQIFAVLN